MSRFERIVVALDFSDCSWDVAANALDLAKALGAEVLLLHVDELPPGVAAQTPVESADGERTDAASLQHGTSATRLQRYAELFQGAGLEASTRVQSGPVAEGILAVAKAEEASLVVMGTHGRAGVARLLSGSIAEGVLRQADCPVLTVRTRHKASCTAGSCGWCESHVTAEARRIEAEADG